MGYAAASLRGIADEVGITKAAIYHYYPSKSELVDGILGALVDEWIARIRKAIGGTSSLREQFLAILEEALRFSADYPEAARFSSAVFIEAANDPRLAASIERRPKLESTIYRDMARAAAARGELAPGLDPRAVVDAFAAVVQGLLYLSSHLSRTRHVAAVRAVEQLLSGALLYAPVE